MRELELILTHILNCERSELYLKRFFWNEENLSRLNSILNKRKSHYPLAYLLGEIEFMGFNFKVSEGVFIPRQETEILVETTINIVKLSNCQTVKLLDIGTGSGCIAISLAKFIPNIKIIATDISSLALRIAKENAVRNKVEERIEFIQVDIFNIKHNTLNIKQLDVIISNPPYIPTEEIKSLPLEVQFEPKISLDGGEDGLNFYRRIVYEAPNYLKKDGLLILEIGFGQCEKVGKILQKSFEITDVVKDYSGINRVIVAQLKETRNPKPEL